YLFFFSYIISIHLIFNLFPYTTLFRSDDVDEILLKFYKLAKSIIDSTDNQLTKDVEMWINFGRWLGLKKPISKRDIHQHLKSQWKRLKHVAEIRKTKVSEISKEILEIEGKKS